jgi:hypothetical protein
MQHVDHLRGWSIKFHANNPIASQWVATKFGVSMNTHSYDELVDMILTRPY